MQCDPGIGPRTGTSYVDCQLLTCCTPETFSDDFYSHISSPSHSRPHFLCSSIQHWQSLPHPSVSQGAHSFESFSHWWSQMYGGNLYYLSLIILQFPDLMLRLCCAFPHKNSQNVSALAQICSASVQNSICALGFTDFHKPNLSRSCRGRVETKMEKGILCGLFLYNEVLQHCAVYL